MMEKQAFSTWNFMNSNVLPALCNVFGHRVRVWTFLSYIMASGTACRVFELNKFHPSRLFYFFALLSEMIAHTCNRAATFQVARERRLLTDSVCILSLLALPQR